MADSTGSGREPVTSREKTRKRATHVVFLLLAASVLAVVLFLRGDPAQPTVMLGLFAGCAIALYLIEVWARTGRIR